ncbi:sulfatase [Aureibaculum sp. 2210JD6-5]|uniref:sulfatase family protein n=1 Tax=Aureibaculum sp. 2210JD6-5 TaxID=3103957 RepID=UPI002AACFDC3|nr:sulfatase [Aureibaculum sp. 2210JD6-5]MDY7393937.1 sulfatase [Aureibaculum sp. 2210JD6-5]
MKYIQKQFVILIQLIFYLTLSFSCSVDKHKIEKPNIVWIISEDNSKHYLKMFDDNGISTPNIESLADHGIIYSRAFSNAPVCSVARSTIISGSYAPRLAAQFHRKITKVPMPDSLMMFPAYLREVGYYTTNNSKEDYNIVKGDNVWDESSRNASWKNRTLGQPFFHVFNISTTHEGGLHFTEKEMNQVVTKTDENSFKVQSNHPDTKIFRYTNAFYRDKIQEMDYKVGEVIKELEKDSLLENTFIFYFGDHGGVLPGSKGYLYETGLHVPLVVHVPQKYEHLIDVKKGSTVNGFVSFIDLAPTVLNLAGAKIPKGIDGRAFLGKNISNEEVNARDETFGYADRFDEKYDHVRSIRKGKYKYIRSYQPFNYDGLMNNYRYKQLAYQEWQSMYKDGKLNKEQSAFYKDRVPEMLFDIESDPFETKNLIADPKYLDITIDLRQRLNTWVKKMPDLSFYPEHFLIENAFYNPVEFGRLHKGEIKKYVDISNLCLSEYKSVKEEIINSLNSEDPWERYWGLITCSIFKESAKPLEKIIRAIAYNDTENLNRMRAAEYLGITKIEDPSSVMIDALYNSKKPAEALLILNSIVLMQSNQHKYKFDIQLKNISATVVENLEVKRRLDYLNIL